MAKRRQETAADNVALENESSAPIADAPAGKEWRIENFPVSRQRRHVDPAHLFEVTSNLIAGPDGTWTRYSVYLYRLWPKIDRKRTNPKNFTYVEKFPGPPFNEQEILRRQGSGNYLICLTDSSRPRGSAEVCRSTYKLNDPDYPPVVDPLELVPDEPDNASYITGLRSRGQMPNTTEGPKAADANTQLIGLLERLVLKKEPPQAGDAHALAAAIELIKTGAEEGLKSAVKNSAAPVGNSTTEMVDALVKLYSMIAPKAEPAGGGVMFDLLRDELKAARAEAAEERKSNRELMRDLTDSKKGGDLVEMMEKQVQLKELAGRLAGGETPDSWPAALMSIGPDLLRTLANFAPRTGPRQATRTNQPATDGQVHAAEPVPDLDDARDIAEKYIPMLLRAFDAGRTGGDLADSIVIIEGRMAYMRVAAFGKENIMLALRLNPDLWAQIAPMEAKIETFVDEFLAYGKESEEEPPPIEAPEKTKPRKQGATKAA